MLLCFPARLDLSAIGEQRFFEVPPDIFDRMEMVSLKSRMRPYRFDRFGSRRWDVLPGMNAGASTYAVPSPIEGSGTAWVLLGSWALSPARPTPIPPRHECRGFSALLVTTMRPV